MFNALSLHPAINRICNILANKLNFNNFGFNWAITIIIFLVYFQILNRSYNNITLSRLRIHKHNQQKMSTQHSFHTTKLHYIKKKHTQFIILNNYEIPTFIHSYSTKSITFQFSIHNYSITIILDKNKNYSTKKSQFRVIIRIFRYNND